MDFIEKALEKNNTLPKEGIIALVQILELSGADIAEMKIGFVDQKELSEGLGIVQPEVSKSIKKLIESGYLKIVDKNGRQNIYQLNPHLAFKSRAKNYRLLCSIWDEDDSQPDDSLEA
jgi:DNA-binding MarR family transcriptional regulator